MSSVSPTVRIGKIRRPVDSGGGGDSEDSVKRQKRLPSLEANKNQAKQQSGMLYERELDTVGELWHTFRIIITCL